MDDKLALEAYASVKQNDDPDIYVLSSNISNDISIYKSDKDHAVNIAKQLLLNKKKEETDLYTKDIFTLFNQWKIQYGMPLNPPKKKKKRLVFFSFHQEILKIMV